MGISRKRVRIPHRLVKNDDAFLSQSSGVSSLSSSNNREDRLGRRVKGVLRSKKAMTFYSSTSSNESAGTLKRTQVIDRTERTKLNESDDSLWYSAPRFCTHVDDGFLEQLTRLYRQRKSELQVFRLVFVARVSLPVRVRVRVRPRVESRGAEKKQAVSGELFRAEF